MTLPRDDALVWMDMEMTGLDPSSCVILEVAAVVTDADLAPLHPGIDLPLAQPDHVLDTMNEWCREQHAASGLVDRVRSAGLPLPEAGNQLLDYLRRFCIEDSAPLCGNTIWQDRRFLMAYMPAVDRFLHYRVIDVSSIKELVRRWYPANHHFPPKRGSHRALDDIYESIEELRFYRSHVFR
jgi:oligoribonuclease